MPSKRRNNFSTRSWYIGSGNKFSAFTRRPSIPFEKLKSIYGEEMQRFSNHSIHGIPQTQLNDAARFQLRKKIRKRIVQEKRKTFFALLITVLATALCIVLGFILVKFLV